MSLVDDRGRVGGSINLIDAIVVVLIVVLVPLAYGAYLLFRTPAAKLQERQMWRDKRLMALAAHKKRAAKEIGN